MKEYDIQNAMISQSVDCLGVPDNRWSNIIQTRRKGQVEGGGDICLS